MLVLLMYARNWLKAQDGQDLIEYAILVGFIAIVAILAVTAAGESVRDLFDWVAGELPVAPGGGGGEEGGG